MINYHALAVTILLLFFFLACINLFALTPLLIIGVIPMSLLVDVYKIVDEYHQGGGYLLLAIGNITQTSLIVTLILIVIYAFR
jgi:hypothetical protein